MQIWDFIIVGTASAGMVVAYMMGYNSAAHEANLRIRAAAAKMGPEAQAEFVRALGAVKAQREHS